MALQARNVDGVRCNGPLAGGTGLNRDEARTNIQNFCQSLDSNLIRTATGQRTTFKPSLGNSNTVISVTFIDEDGCDKSTSIKLSGDDCASTLDSLIDSCDANADYLGRYGGEIIQDCLKYSITTEVEEKIACGGNPHRPATDLNDWAVERAIGKYCGDSMTLQPDFSTSHFTQQVPDGMSYANVAAGDLYVRVAAQFDDQGQEGCAESKSFDTDGQECRRKLRAVWNECREKGGGLSENGANGCIVWTMWGQTV